MRACIKQESKDASKIAPSQPRSAWVSFIELAYNTDISDRSQHVSMRVDK